MTKWQKLLTTLMNQIADFVGRPLVFVVVIVLIAVWFGLIRTMEYDTWLDIIDVAIFVVTFLLLFVIQASQNADTQAIQDKLDEIIEALPEARTDVEGEEKEIKKGRKANR